MHICKSSAQLTEDQMSTLSLDLGCKVSYVAQVINEQRWDYRVHREVLTERDVKLLGDSGLEVLI